MSQSLHFGLYNLMGFGFCFHQMSFLATPHKHSLDWESIWVVVVVVAGMVIKLMVSILANQSLILVFPISSPGAGYDQIMRKFGICRDYAKVCLGIPLRTLFTFCTREPVRVTLKAAATNIALQWTLTSATKEQHGRM